MYDALIASAIGQKLTAAGYSIINTGGGCMSWALETPSASLILIGHEDADSEFDLGEGGDETTWATQVTDADGGHVEWLDRKGSLDFCIAAMAKVDAEEIAPQAPPQDYRISERRNIGLTCADRDAMQAQGLCTYPNCACIVQTSTTKPSPDCARGLAQYAEVVVAIDDDCEEIVLHSPEEWAGFLKENNDGADILSTMIPTLDAALQAAKGDGFYIGGGAAARFHITYREA